MNIFISNNSLDVIKPIIENVLHFFNWLRYMYNLLLISNGHVKF